MDIASGVGSFLIVAWAVERQPALGFAAVPASIGAALTYSAYLWHVDLLETIPSTPLALAAVVGVSTAVYLIVERPCIHVGRHVARNLKVEGLERSPVLLRRLIGSGNPGASGRSTRLG
jgi:peptidoglycan/LPS O-acetylase OafA/YrhL